MALKWVDQHPCQHLKFVLKTDDDMLINIRPLISDLRTLTGPVLFGNLYTSSKPYRDPSSKWYVPYERYKGDRYPPYVSGSAYVMSRDVASALYAAALDLPLFESEDVFVTGFCARRANVTPQHRSRLWLTKRRPGDPVYTCLYQNVLAVHKMTSHELVQVWKDLQGYSCNILDYFIEFVKYHFKELIR